MLLTKEFKNVKTEHLQKLNYLYVYNSHVFYSLLQISHITLSKSDLNWSDVNFM